jgi:peptidylprolyl isomerase
MQDAIPEIPSEFDALPRLLGRATVRINTTQGAMTAVVDGYNAPLTAGAFIDLALKGFYDGLPFTRAEDFYILQTGDPEGPEIGYIDPSTKQERHVPLEIRVPGEPETFYNQTFEDVGLYKATPTLPFATLGTLGWAHSDQALDDGSSQFFMFLYEAELTPAGLNLVDGRNAAFGYLVDGFDVLEELGVDDRVLTITVTDGADRLQAHA